MVAGSGDDKAVRVWALDWDCDYSTPIPNGKPFGHYLLAEQLGQGRRGPVFRAYDTAAKREVALKPLTTLGSWGRRFEPIRRHHRAKEMAK